MTGTLRKRRPEREVLSDSMDVQGAKRFHAKETDQFLHLRQLDKTLAGEEEDTDYAPSEELVNKVMRSFEEEISTTCSTSYTSSANCRDNSMASDISDNHDGQTIASDPGNDLCYLVEASDDDLGIPPGPVLDLNDEVCLSPKKTSEGLMESRDLKSLGENLHFEEDFGNYQRFAVYEDPWDASQVQDYMNRDFVSQNMLFDGDFSAMWRLEPTDGILPL